VKAAVLDAFHAPLAVQEIPEPCRQRPDDVVVRVAGAGVCHTDVHLWTGEWSDVAHRTLQLPHILGHENVGWIEELSSSESGTDLMVGDPVLLFPMRACGACEPCRAGREMLCLTGKEPGIHSVPGGYAELLVTGERCLVPAPPLEDLAAIAPLADAGLTAYHAVRKSMPWLRPGSAAVVVGAGGLGQFAVQLLKVLVHARVIAVDVVEDRLLVARELGADDLVSPQRDGFADRVRALTAGQGADAVFDFVGSSETIRGALSALRRGGACTVVGYGGEAVVPSRELVQGDLVLQGTLAGEYEDLIDLLELWRAGLITCRYRTYPLSAASEVLGMLEAGQLSERAVLVH